jgi:DNA primase
VVEGYFDLIALHRAGIPEAVAPCGTALTPDHAKRLRRYTREVIVMFDGDEAGQRAVERSLPVLATAGMRVRAAFLAEGDDPDTLLEREGEEALRACVDAAVPLIDTLIDQRLGMKALHEWEAADLARSFAPVLAAVPDEIERASYERRIASRLDLSPAAVARALREGTRERGVPRASADETPPPSTPIEIDPIVRTLLAALGVCPELVALVDQRLDRECWPGGQSGILLEHSLDALRTRGSDGLAHLLSPAAEELPVELRSVLSHALFESDPGDKATAERAVRDCVARLRIRALDRTSRELSARLESCNDPSEVDSLLERKQQTLSERNVLWNEVHQS